MDENNETVQRNHDSVTNQLLTLLMLMKRKEINEKKTPIYDSDGDDYDERNVLEENTIAIKSYKIVALANKWEREQETNPHLVAANLTT